MFEVGGKGRIDRDDHGPTWMVEEEGRMKPMPVGRSSGNSGSSSSARCTSPEGPVGEARPTEFGVAGRRKTALDRVSWRRSGGRTCRQGRRIWRTSCEEWETSGRGVGVQRQAAVRKSEGKIDLDPCWMTRIRSRSRCADGTASKSVSRKAPVRGTSESLRVSGYPSFCVPPGGVGGRRTRTNGRQ